MNLLEKDKIYVAGSNGMVGSAICRLLNKIGYKIEYLSSLNKIDALACALNHSGFKLDKLKFLLRIISFVLTPFLKKFNIAPEIICIVSKI